MKLRFSLQLACLLLCAACIQTFKTEQRVVELPKDDPRTSLATCESIVRDLVAGGLGKRVQEKFPSLTEAQTQGIFMNWNVGQFQSGKSVFITTGMKYQGEVAEAKEVADFLKAEAEAAIKKYFSEAK